MWASRKKQNMLRLPINESKIAEIIRFTLVGTLAFVIDFSVLNFFFSHRWGLYLATALGFLAGIIVNYILSVLFVFRSNGAFLAFVGLGIIGFMLTEMGMYLAVGVLAMHYQFAKILVTGIVLVWNYLSRKLFIFRERRCPTH